MKKENEIVGNIFLIKDSASCEALFYIWNKCLKDDVDRKKQELLEFEQEWKRKAHEIIDETTDEAVSEGRRGCLIGVVFRVILGVFTGWYVIGAGDQLIDNAMTKSNARRLHETLDQYDLATALRKITQGHIEIPYELQPGIRDFETKAWIVQYLSDVKNLVSAANEEIGKSSEKEEAFAHAFYSLLEAESETKSLYSALFGALKQMNINTGNIPGLLDTYISKGGYALFSLKSDISEWKSAYNNALSAGEKTEEA